MFNQLLLARKSLKEKWIYKWPSILYFKTKKREKFGKTFISEQIKFIKEKYLVY